MNKKEVVSQSLCLPVLPLCSSFKGLIAQCNAKHTQGGTEIQEKTPCL